ncbi:MAG: DUF3536 domain-containing protein [Candidatus Hydrogenedentota bacterium]
MNRGALVIHGHFYQPPRENPWLGVIEHQASAYPFHDWNQRITAECYRPNVVSRVLNPIGRIVALINNFEYISFNIGPTLMDYIRKYHKEIYDKIIEADKKSIERLGYGNAIAQVYNHVIMPLANETDKETQVYWGIEDFRFHFNRDPEAMWLSETAICYETLNVLHRFGMKYVILSPGQALKIKAFDAELWEDVSAGNIDTSVPYRIFLKDENNEELKDKYIDVFFYDKNISQAVAFEGLLRSADNFAERIASTAKNYEKKEVDYLISIVTDGESYGHHEKFGDMCLSALIDIKLKNLNLNITNFTAYLNNNTPKFEVELKPTSSWSCAHGVERWRDDCGCTTDSKQGWNQKWRKPLRKAFDTLNDRLMTIFKREGKKLFHKPEMARNHYIEVLISTSYKDDFLKYEMEEEAYKDINNREKALKLLESQKFAMMTFTSCGWFFSDISGIEPVMNMKFALRAIEFVTDFTDEKIILAELLSTLAKAKSNISEMGNGKTIFEKFVLTSQIPPAERIAIRVLKAVVFSENKVDEIKYNDKLEFEKIDEVSEDGFKLLFYKGEIFEYNILKKHKFIMMCFNKTPGFEPDGYVWLDSDVDADKIINKFNALRKTKKTIYEIMENIRSFGSPAHYSISDLPYDEKCELFEEMIKSLKTEMVLMFRKVYEDNKNLIGFCRRERLRMPDELKTPVVLTIGHRLIEELKSAKHNLTDKNIDSILKSLIEVKDLKLEIQLDEIGRLFQQVILNNLIKYEEKLDKNLITKLEKLVAGNNIYKMPEYYKIQEFAFDFLHSKIIEIVDKNAEPDDVDKDLIEGIMSFLRVCNYLNIDTSFIKDKIEIYKKILSADYLNWP